MSSKAVKTETKKPAQPASGKQANNAAKTNGSSKTKENGAVNGAAAANGAAKKPAPAANGAAASGLVKKQSARSNGFAIVKAVVSGDTLVIMGSVQGGQAPEKQVTLSGINAPKFARSKNQVDEPLAWEAREFLRKRLIGQQVQFTVNHVAESGREYGTVVHNDENLAHAILRAGWAHVKLGNPNKEGKQRPEVEELLAIQQEAESLHLGVHSRQFTQSQMRTIDWAPDAKQLFADYKGLELPAVVDFVRDGSTLRCELPFEAGKHTMVLVHLAGIQSPRTPLPLSVQQQNDAVAAPKAAEPFALEAQAFTETRLLHRDVHVILQGIDKFGNLFGTVKYPKGNISLKLVELGYAKFVPWSAALTNYAAQLKEAEAIAKSKKLRLYSSFDASTESEELPATEYNAKVIQIVSGDTLIVQDQNNTERRVCLASIRAPRVGNARVGAKDELCAQEAKEFLRSCLVGHKVKVVPEYVRSTDNDKTVRQFVSIFLGASNVTSLLLSAGLATVIRHRIDEDRSQHYEEYLGLETTATNAKKGLHNPKKVAPARIIDLTERFLSRSTSEEKTEAKEAPKPAGKKDDKKKGDEAVPQAKQLSAKAKQFLPFLQKDKHQTALNAVVEYVFSGSRLKLYVAKENVMISFALAGVRVPAGKDNKEWSEKALQFTRSRCLQHTVRIEVEALDRGDNFVGQVFIGKQNLSIALLQEGLASLVPGIAARSAYSKELHDAQHEAREAKKGLWVNYVEPTPEELAAEEKEHEVTIDPTMVNSNITIEISEILDASSFYCHVVGDKNFELVENRMKNFESEVVEAADFNPQPNSLVAGLFTDNQWYRVRVESIDGDNFTVFFVDYGNHDVCERVHLRPLPADLAKIPAGARLSYLAGIKAPKGEEYHDAATQAFADLAYGRALSAKVEYVDSYGRLHLSLSDSESPVSINSQLVKAGWVRVLPRVPRDMVDVVKALRVDEASAKQSHYNIWEYGDVSDDEDEDEKAKKEAAVNTAAKGKGKK